MARNIAFLLAPSLVAVACDGGTGTDPREGLTCSGNGTCSVDNDEAMCACDEGYGGDLCAECGEGYHDEGGACVVKEVCEAGSCSGHGTCDESSGAAVCACEVEYAGPDCGICAGGYQDNDGDGTCLPDCATSGLDCGLLWTCDDSSGIPICTCDTGWDGAACDVCAAGYHDEGSNCVADTYCQVDTCPGHGSCDDSSGTPVCICDAGWSGLDCSVDLTVLNWVSIPGETFMMGSDTGYTNEQPVHQLRVKFYPP